MDLNAIWNENTKEKHSSFVDIIQIYSDKTATTLKSNPIVVYPAEIVLLNFTSDFQKFLINHGHRNVGQLLVLVSNSFEETRDDNISEDCAVKYGKTIISL